MRKAVTFLLGGAMTALSLSAQVLNDPGVSLSVDGQGNLYRVTDSGDPAGFGTLYRRASEETSGTVVQINGSPIEEMKAVEASGDTVIAVGANSGRIVRSGDVGETWADGDDADGSSTFRPANGTWHSVATDRADTWLAVGQVNGTLAAALSTNEGQDWTRVDPANPPIGNTVFREVVYDPVSRLWVAVGDDGFGGLAWTYDPSASGGSEPWSEVDLSAKMPSPLRAVAANGRGDLLAGGEDGELIALRGLGDDPPTITTQSGMVSEALYAVTALPDGTFLAGGEDTTQIAYHPPTLARTGVDEWTSLPGKPGNGTIHDYDVPAEAAVPSVAVTDFGEEPLLFVQGALNLGDRAINAPETSGTVTLANLGGGTLTVESVTVGSGPFSLGTITVDASSVSPSFDLESGQSALATVRFSTSSTGNFDDALTVETAASGTLAAALAASGVPNPSFTSSFPTTEIVEGREFSYSITVNDLNYPDEIALSVSSGSLPPGLALTDEGGGNGTLAGIPEEGSADSYSFTIEASVEATGGTAEQQVNATVLTPPSLSLSANLDFGNVLVDSTASETFTVFNNGEATLEVTGVNSNDSVFPVGDSTGFSLAGNSSRDVSVSFQPQSAGPDVATITVSSATAGSSTLEASGYGAADPLQLYLRDAGLSTEELAADDDPDTDSRENLLEFAFGSDPASASSLPQMIASTVSDGGSSYPALSFQHRETDPTENPFSVDGITYTVQGSTDLTTWDESVVVATNPSGLPTPETGYEWITFRLANTPLSTSGAKGFLRVMVSEEAGDG